MKTIVFFVSCILATALVAPVLVDPVPKAEEGFTLAGIVPNDVFLYVAERPSPEREFLDRYWGEIFEALGQSGIGGDRFRNRQRSIRANVPDARLGGVQAKDAGAPFMNIALPRLFGNRPSGKIDPAQIAVLNVPFGHVAQVNNGRRRSEFIGVVFIAQRNFETVVPPGLHGAGVKIDGRSP